MNIQLVSVEVYLREALIFIMMIMIARIEIRQVHRQIEHLFQVWPSSGWTTGRAMKKIFFFSSLFSFLFFLPHFFFTKMYFIQLLTTNALCCVVGQNLWIDWQKLKVWAHTQSGSLDLLLVSLSYSALLVGSEDGHPLILFGATRYLLLAPNGTWHRWSAPVGTAW